MTQLSLMIALFSCVQPFSFASELIGRKTSYSDIVLSFSEPSQDPTMNPSHQFSGTHELGCTT